MTLGPNALSIDELRFRVRPYAPSSITSDSGVLRMGVSGPGTGGRTKVIVDNVRIEYMDD